MTASFPARPDGSLLPVVAPGFSQCLGIPRHPDQDPALLEHSLRRPAARQARLLALISGMSGAHPAEALQLLQLCAVSRLSHFTRCLPPDVAAPFFIQQDALILDTFRTISSCPAELGAFCTFRLPVSLGGAAITSLASHSVARSIGGYYDYAGPLTARLRLMPRANWMLCGALSHYLSDPEGSVASTFP